MMKKITATICLFLATIAVSGCSVFGDSGVDFAVERGHRFGGGVNEKFWRATVSLLASGL